jgi:hypothetical protein
MIFQGTWLSLSASSGMIIEATFRSALGALLMSSLEEKSEPGCS